MKKTKFIIISSLLFFVVGCSSEKIEKLGAEIKANQKIKISEILSTPNKFIGKKILVEGNVLDVCTDAGCWMDIASDVPNQKIKIKVKDGDIIFPVKAKGKSALVEGVVYSIELDEVEAKEYFLHMAEDAGKEFDSTLVTGHMTIYQIKGLGAEIKM
ncbi:MAG: hypothetical protein A2315_16475 [Ignavibacteria bacterium RIFOXYB2_FULL_35_12]|nr:MAG: hypothetical protein A2058_11970 [Ignavibacteria bacterium GWA2_36_19]OGU61286.1 MAG: hypothetical protein A2X60_13390 [Ignavibacteria bacterium GWF2_35_20]OGU81071.1 MAG: hypothetical protein A2W11_03890 [Ignavibacteria bacterium RBG_16_35_7]OGU81476.1 MAG: hypothetical protein A2254_03300 [Ignavibacteria bacterium RIFOXYA2_FULL_35_9]OGU84122.1 MAG: hypothetical protein A3K31_10995 [Ignavibacteria bacterium RIFOXYA12_FULL_35_25]OGU92231.1 MAG: hypothetical protein A2492_13960 [Ignavib